MSDERIGIGSIVEKIVSGFLFGVGFWVAKIFVDWVAGRF